MHSNMLCRILRIVVFKQNRCFLEYLDHPKNVSHPMIMRQKKFISHENVVKYFGTLVTHSAPRYTTLKTTGP